MKQVSGNLVRLIVLACVFLFVVYLLRLVLLPFVAAGAIACAGEPLIRVIVRRLHWPRWGAALLLFLIVLILFAAAGYAIAVLGVPQLEDIARGLPVEIRELLTRLLGHHKLHLFGQVLTPSGIAGQIQNELQQRIAFGSALQAADFSLAFVMGIILTLVLIVYFLLTGPRLVKGGIWLVPPQYRAAAEMLAAQMLPIIWRYLLGMVIIVVYAAILTWLVTGWLLGVSHSLLFGIVVGFLELVPVIGPTVSAILIGALAVTRGSTGSILGFAAFAFGLRLSIDQVIGPLVLGGAVALPAPLIIFAMLAGGAIWGILGVVVAVPFAAIIRAALKIAYEQNPNDFALKRAQ